jgi:hypothetical protein
VARRDYSTRRFSDKSEIQRAIELRQHRVTSAGNLIRCYQPLLKTKTVGTHGSKHDFESAMRILVPQEEGVGAKTPSRDPAQFTISIWMRLFVLLFHDIRMTFAKYADSETSCLHLQKKENNQVTSITHSYVHISDKGTRHDFRAQVTPARSDNPPAVHSGQELEGACPGCNHRGSGQKFAGS